MDIRAYYKKSKQNQREFISLCWQNGIMYVSTMRYITIELRKRYHITEFMLSLAKKIEIKNGFLILIF